MIKRIGRRFVSLLLTFVTILTLLPAMTLPALAAATSGTVAGLAVENIGLSFTGDAADAWSANGTTITGSAQSSSGCSTTHYSSTLTIKNEGSTTAVLSFGYTIEQNSGTIQVDGQEKKEGGNFSKELAPLGSITVYIKSGDTEKPTKITMNNVKLEASATATVTFQPAENGHYTVDGKNIIEEYTKSQSSAESYHVVATPDKGFQFLGWYDATNEIYLQGSADSSINVSSGTFKVTAKFGRIGTTFQVQVGTSDLIWDDLNDAIISTKNNSSGYIKQLESCAISGKYTIPSGVTLLIPFDDAGTPYTNKPGYVASYETQKVFRKLTMAPGSSITVNGAISVGGKYSQQQQKQGPTGPYGQIDMAAGSSIVLKNSANLYAWGYITGDGQITAESGATVYECFQLRDWRGGDASQSMKNRKEKVFPFSQYYVQNIEAPLTIQYGATEKTYFSVRILKQNIETTIDFIGSDGLFKLEEGGSITKRYIPKEGRTEYTTNGTASLDRLFVEINVLNLISQDIRSDDYALPINGNMTLNIASGKVTSKYDLCLLPGVQINIAKDAELVVAENASLYVYDSEQWGDYCFNDNKKIADVYYSPSPDRYKRTEYDLVPAKIDVNGTLTAAGSIYTTKSGANICSSEGSGRFVQQGTPGTATVTYQATQEGTKITSYPQIPITAAQLKNADGVNPSYTPTADSSAGATFTYCTGSECVGKWVPNLKVAAIIDSTGKQTPYPSLKAAVDTYSPDNSTAPKNYIQMLHSTTESITTDKDLYLDLNGCTVTGDFTMNGNTLYGMDSSSKEYVAPKGKIVGAVSGYARTCQSPTVKVDDVDTYLGNEDTTQTLSFHHFNISVTGYRFELAAPQCALFFIGKFQGDDAAKKHLTSLGFTLKDIDKTEKKYGCTITGKTIPLMPTGGGTSTSEVVQDAEGAYFFEAYLMRSFNKNDTAAYQTKISATAQASFDNGGKQQSDPRNLSFEDAWTNPGELDPAQKDILDKFLKALNIPNP